MMWKIDKKWIAGTFLLGTALVLLDALVLEKYYFQIKSFDIGNIKDKRGKISLILLTDLHFEQTIGSQHKKLAKKVNALDADLILISGDAIDEDGSRRPLNRFLGMLNPITKKVAILGNHEHERRVDLEELKHVYQRHNGDLLINESKAYQIREVRLMVTGLDDFIDGDGRFTKAVSSVGREENHIVLIHSPLQQEKVKRKIKEINESRSEEKKLNISYLFAGHTHGGQITFFRFAPVLPEQSGGYVKGWYNNERPYLYVSKGFGTSIIPFRFGARSELTVLHYFI